MNYKKPRQYVLTGSAKKVGKSLARGRKTSIFQQLLKNKHRRPQAAKIIGHLIKGEMEQICSDKRVSILRDTSEAAMKGFSWESVWLELQHSTPFLMAILEHSFPAKARNERINETIALHVCSNVTEVATTLNVPCAGSNFPSVTCTSKLDTPASRQAVISTVF